jgi:hypothetical protein
MDDGKGSRKHQTSPENNSPRKMMCVFLGIKFVMFSCKEPADCCVGTCAQ